MSESKIKLTGWQAIAVVVVFIGAFGIRLMTLSDKKDDDALVRQIEMRLMTDYLPNDVEKLKAVYETGDVDDVDRVVESIASTKLNVESAKASFPLFKFSTPKDVVVKVCYSVNDASGTREKGMKYYLFRHGALGNTWQYKYESGPVSYYLNFF